MSQHHLLADWYRTLPADAAILDVGCFGLAQLELSRKLGLTGHRHHGVDYTDYAGVPEGFVYRKADLNREPIPFADDSFDLVVCSHVLEHLIQPVDFFGECVRVCKPGGLIYVATPSERALLLPGMPFAHDKFFSLSFFDDPTHLGRPWTPQSLYRLACYWSCQPLETGHQTFPLRHRILGLFRILHARLTRNGRKLQDQVWGVLGWSSFLAARKQAAIHGKPAFQYYIPADR
jgi:SAM-dependent methyltransferase